MKATHLANEIHFWNSNKRFRHYIRIHLNIPIQIKSNNWNTEAIEISKPGTSKRLFQHRPTIINVRVDLWGFEIPIVAIHSLAQRIAKFQSGWISPKFAPREPKTNRKRLIRTVLTKFRPERIHSIHTYSIVGFILCGAGVGFIHKTTCRYLTAGTTLSN